MFEVPLPYLAVYVALLLVLLALPLLARWRWGLRASLAVTAAELLALFLVAYFLIADPPPPRPMPEKGKLEHLMKGHAEGMAYAIVWLTIWAIPSLAALLGGALSLLWSAALAIRRSIAGRKAEAAQLSGPA